MTAVRRVAVVGGHGKTGRAVAAALTDRGAEAVAAGRAEWDRLAEVLAGCEAAYVVAPNLHPDEPAYVAHVLAAARAAGVGRVGYHSVASPYVPAMPHHLGKAAAEDVVRRGGLPWTILQPGAYLQNLDLTDTVRLPYRADAPFGFADLAEVARGGRGGAARRRPRGRDLRAGVGPGERRRPRRRGRRRRGGAAAHGGAGGP